MPRLNGKLLKEARQQRYESLDQVAAEVGIGGGHLRNIENGHAPAHRDVAIRLAARFGIPLGELLNLSSPTSASVSTISLSDRISYNVIDAAKVIGVKPRTIRDAIKSGDLKAGWLGQGYVIPRAELEEFVERSMKNCPLPRSA